MKIYCSGIGGIGLSAYAALQHAAGHRVLGSDQSLTPLTVDLEGQGITVFSSQDGSNIPSDADLFVYSEAIPEHAPERKKATELGIVQKSYFEALGELSKDHTVIAVCGTHGKSSTTAMATLALIDAGMDPTVVVGTKIPQLDGRNWRKGESDIFLLEACEYRGSFLNLHPRIVLMTNVDGDHFDSFKNLEDYQNAYSEFLARLPEDGVVITHMQDADCQRIAKQSCKPVLDADICPKVELSVPGVHMQENALLVSALSDHMGFSASKSLKSFTGTWRRMEVKGDTSSGVTVIDDYAHHPVEIAATIAAAREAYPGRRIVCLFQPHTHDRTIQFYQEFLIAFDAADLVVTTDIYDARPEIEKERVDIAQFTADIHTTAQYGGPPMEARTLLERDILQSRDVLLVLGAGDITTIATEMVS
jgi:UDP-N-acetylmuramate--alanine ligase